jgi:hypothetical protein
MPRLSGKQAAGTATHDSDCCSEGQSEGGQAEVQSFSPAPTVPHAVHGSSVHDHTRTVQRQPLLCHTAKAGVGVFVSPAILTCDQFSVGEVRLHSSPTDAESLGLRFVHN